jgi:DNA-binding LytR/AlgR family response regulator
MIIEDEPLAARLLADYVNQVPYLNLEKKCQDALEALRYLDNIRVDLIFLDIHLPQLKGLDFIRKLSDPPFIIITTAYHEYALESYEFPVVDYLLKPIESSRFMQAMDKFQQFTSNIGTSDSKPITKEREYKLVRERGRQVKVYLEDVLFIESALEYVHINMKQHQVVTVKHSMKSIQRILIPLKLIQIHRSYLVVPDKIVAFTSKVIELPGHQLPIGRLFRAETLAVLNPK